MTLSLILNPDINALHTDNEVCSQGIHKSEPKQNTFYSSPVGQWSFVISVPVCLSVHEHISGTAGAIFTKFCVQIPCGCGSVLLRRRCAILCTSSFMDGVTLCSRLSARMPECQTIKNGGLDQYSAGPFRQQQFETAGIEAVKVLCM